MDNNIQAEINKIKVNLGNFKALQKEVTKIKTTLETLRKVKT